MARSAVAPSKFAFSDAVLESSVESYFIRQVALVLRGEAKKFVGYRGWPDRIVVLPFGITDWVELKRPKGGRFEPLQLRTHDRLRRMGHKVFVILNRTQVDNYIDDARRRISAIQLSQ